MEAINEAMLKAIESHDTDQFMSLVKQDPASVDAPLSEFRDKPLNYAAWQGATSIVQFLLELGANPNVRGCDGFSPLHYTAKYGHVDSAKLLIEAGADINQKDDMKHPAAFYGARGRIPECEKVARILMEVGAELDLNTLVSLGEVEVVCNRLAADPQSLKEAPYPADLIDDAVIMIAVRIQENVVPQAIGGEQEEILAKYKGMMTRLIEAGADINAVGSALIPPLFQAASLGYSCLVRFLLEKGADVNYRLPNGESALYHAFNNKDVEKVLRGYGFTK